MNPPVFIHVLSLDTVGGVESLYAHFIKEAIERGDAQHFTSVCGKPPHKKFIRHFETLHHRPFLEEHIMGIRLPKFLKKIVRMRRWMVEDLINPRCWVFWNRIEEAPSPGTAAYYEHGAAWNVSFSKKRMGFFSHCSRFLANSKAATVILKEKWHITSPITVIANPLRPDIELAKTPRTALTGSSLRLGFIGRFVPVKGVFIALHTLKILRERGIDATITFAGAGPLQEKAQKMARRLAIEPFVIWNGCIEQVLQFYDSIDLLLVPSIREPLGLVALEAAARGVPVIAACVDGLPEVVHDEQTGLCIVPTLAIAQAQELVMGFDGIPEIVVNPKTQTIEQPKLVDPRHMADAIQKVISDSALYHQFSANGISHARSRSDFQSYFNAIQLILDKINQDSTEEEEALSSLH